MASISEQRLREMEAEMNRFEQEIAPPDGGGMIIGSSTFNTVEAQLKHIRHQTSGQLSSLAPPPPPPPPPPGPPPSQRGPGNDCANNGHHLDIPLSALVPPPPPPPPPEPAPEQNNDPPPLLPPPPPPPPLLNRPAFVPPQLRHRAPLPPRPPMHPHPHQPHHHPHPGMGPDGPRRYPGPPHHMGPMGGPGPGPYRHPMGHPPGPPMGHPPGPMNHHHHAPMGGPPMMHQQPQSGMGYPPQGPYPQPGGGGGGFQPMMGVGGGEVTGPTSAPDIPAIETPDPAVAAAFDETQTNPAVIEAKPQVIYSAPPLRNVSKKSKKGKEKKRGDNSTTSHGGGVERTGDGDSTHPAAATTMGLDVGGEGGEGGMGGSSLQVEAVMVVDMELDMEDGVPMMMGGGAGGVGGGGKKEKREKKKKFLRTAASTVWEDPTLAEWEQDDFRMFCGDLGNEVTDESLQRAFGKYPSFIKAKVVRDRRTNKTKGYGFVSFRDPVDFGRAMREMNGKYVGNRPIKLRKSSWKDRSIEVVRKKEKEKKRLGLK